MRRDTIAILALAAFHVYAQDASSLGITGTVLPGDDLPTGFLSYPSITEGVPLLSTGSTNSDVSNSFTGENSAETTSSVEYLTINGGKTTTTAISGTALSTTSSVAPTNTQPCNNYPEFCDRKYSNITEVCAHNSPFVRPDNAASNQYLDVTSQLNDGIRMLQGQVHFVNDTLFYCHTSCDLLNAGTVEDYLITFYGWIASHPYDVVTLLFSNSNRVEPRYFADALRSAGLERFIYSPPKTKMTLDEWPTLGELILNGKRVVVFMDYGADQSEVPYILDEFAYMWETPFSPTDTSFPCTVGRPPGLSENQSRNMLYLANHNLNVRFMLGPASFLLPNTVEIDQTNGINGTASLGLATERCTGEYES